MGRKRFQAPRVKAYVSAAGVRYWKAEYRTYGADGKAKHHSPTWRQNEYSKQQAQDELDATVRRETRGDRLDGATTLRDYWERTYWPIKREHLSRHSQDNYASAWGKHLKPLHGIPLAEVTRYDVDACIVAMAKAGYSASACSHSLHVVGTLLNEAHQEGLIPRNPARGIKVPRSARPEAATRSLTESEVQTLFATASPTERPLWRLLCLCGLRISEAYGLCDTDLLPGRRLLVERQSHSSGLIETKNRKSRRVPVPLELWGELQELAQRSGFLFRRADGSRRCANYQDSRDLMLAARKAAGIADLTYRMCRTTFATLYQGDVADIQAIAGHATPDFTVERYRRAIDERQQREADAMEARLKPRLRRVK